MSDRDPAVPDPMSDLENFSLEGDAVHPLPASEVRRRGDRMRRRRTGALAAGAAAAVAVIATSSVVAAQNLTGGDDTQPAPQPSPTETTSEPPTEPPTIPQDFPFFDTSAGEVPPTHEATLAKQLDYCGDRPLASVKPVDVLSAEVSGGETSEIRTLLLFGDDAAAGAAEAALLASAAACPESSSDDVQVTNRVLPVSPDWPGRTIQQTSSAAATPEFASYYFVQTLRAGPALLLTSSVLVGEGIQVDRDAGLEQARSNKDAWVTAMEEFGPVAEPTPGGSDPSGQARTEIPKDFPIDSGLEDTDADSEIVGPSATAEGVNELELCGSSQLPTGYVARLAVRYTAPEYGDSRELVTFADADAAVRYVAALRDAVRDCPEEGLGRTVTVLEADTGYDSVTFALSSQEGLGAEVYQVVRVGNAVLLTDEASHGTLDSARRDAPERTALADRLTPEMCVFTEAGC